MITDIILSLLPTASTSVVKQLMNGFRLITSLITYDSIEVILDNLLRTNNKDEESEGEDGDDDNNEVESEEDCEDDEDEDSEDEDGEEDEEPTEIEKFRAKLSSILGPDVDDDEEHGADDEEMLKLDEALSEAFREKMGSSKKEKIRELKLNDDFKCRVLTVYSTILKRRSLPINFVIPVLPIVINLSKKNSALADKAVSVLGEMSSIPASRIDIEDVESDVLNTLSTVVSGMF